ncbi:MAG: amino acid racemase [Candidatus Micrarchaeota archaeon]|nr:amino acid racemase [Candidatus Micrarchaeota archaeon]
MKHIGIVAITAEGATLCYRTIVSEAGKLLGQNKHPEITLNNAPFDEILSAQNKGDWSKVANVILNSIAKLQKAGTEFAVIPANSVHYSFDEIKKKSTIPVLSIIEITAEECKKLGYKKVGLVGTKLTMENSLYQKPLQKYDIELVIPEKKDREKINCIIFNEIVLNKIISTNEIVEIINKLKQNGCDAVILGCTEIPIVINEQNSPLPFIDTTRLLAIKALEYSLK